VPYKILNEKGDWLVQVQRGGIRKTQRGSGGEKEAKRVEAQLLAGLDAEEGRRRAAKVLGLELSPKPNASVVPPTLLEFFSERWVKHAEVTQNARTRNRSAFWFQYVLYYLGEKRLTDCCEPRVINEFIEKMVTNGQLSFARNKDGTPRKILGKELRHSTINKSLQGLRSLLYLAYQEKVIPSAPAINMLPEDNSDALVPPTEEQFARLLDVCENYHLVAPLLRQVTEFTAETGLRPGEVFALTRRSVDLDRSSIRIETQGRVTMVNGKPWKPKCNKFREVPLSTKAKAIMVERCTRLEPDDLVFPNRGGAPYIRLDYAPKDSGKGFFPDAVKAAGMKGSMTFKHLRHLFAVRLLTRANHGCERDARALEYSADGKAVWAVRVGCASEVGRSQGPRPLLTLQTVKGTSRRVERSP